MVSANYFSGNFSGGQNTLLLLVDSIRRCLVHALAVYNLHRIGSEKAKRY